jgi:hypothetical protein
MTYEAPQSLLLSLLHSLADRMFTKHSGPVGKI